MATKKENKKDYLERLKKQVRSKLADMGVYDGPEKDVNPSNYERNPDKDRIKTTVNILMKDVKKHTNKVKKMVNDKKKSVEMAEDQEILDLLQKLDQQTNNLSEHLQNVDTDDVDETDANSVVPGEDSFIKDKNESNVKKMFEVEDEISPNDAAQLLSEEEDIDINSKIDELFSGLDAVSDSDEIEEDESDEIEEDESDEIEEDESDEIEEDESVVVSNLETDIAAKIDELFAESSDDVIQEDDFDESSDIDEQEDDLNYSDEEEEKMNQIINEVEDLYSEDIPEDVDVDSEDIVI